MANLTRKNFTEIAEAVGIESRAVAASDKEGYTKEEVAEMLDAISLRLARAMSGTNAQFNRPRFLAACGVEEGR
jgi:hypothetical protein